MPLQGWPAASVPLRRTRQRLHPRQGHRPNQRTSRRTPQPASNPSLYNRRPDRTRPRRRDCANRERGRGRRLIGASNQLKGVPMSTRILALVGNLRAGSYNRRLAEAAAKYSPEGSAPRGHRLAGEARLDDQIREPQHLTRVHRLAAALRRGSTSGGGRRSTWGFGISAGEEPDLSGP
jgi:hypothetical protein